MMESYQELSTENNAQTFSQLDSYPWETDTEFQTGLRAILSSATSPSQIPPLTLRARCFYYNRKHPDTPIDFEAYLRHVSTLPPTTSSPDSIRNTTSADTTTAPTSPQSFPDTQTQPQYPHTFASLVSLIQSGAPIPGIRDIPDTTLPELASEAKGSKRRKPWEKEDLEVVDENGTFGDRRDEPVIVQEYPEGV